MHGPGTIQINPDYITLAVIGIKMRLIQISELDIFCLFDIKLNKPFRDNLNLIN